MIGTLVRTEREEVKCKWEGTVGIESRDEKGSRSDRAS